MDSGLLDMFLQETKEQIQKMEEDFLLLEAGNADEDVINRIFRMAHSVKGSAATIGFEDMFDISHNMENLLDKIRDKNIIVDDEVMDILFKGVDILKNIHDSISSGQKHDIDISSVSKDIENIILVKSINSEKNEDNFEVLKEQKNQIIKDDDKLPCRVDNELYTYRIKIIMESSTEMKTVKGFMIVNNLAQIGTIIKAIPEDFEKVSNEDYDGVLEVIFNTKRECKEIYENINSLSEIEKIHIEKIEQNSLNGECNRNFKFIEECVEHKKENTIRIDVGKIDKLFNLVGEFIIDKETLNQLTSELKIKYKNEALINKLINLLPHISYIGSELQQTVMSTRMLPLENIFNRFPRMVRDLCKKCNKNVEFIIKGKETEIDRKIIEELIDPLTHIIRNAIDHGLETVEERKKTGKNEAAKLKLSAYHEENNVVIVIEDDGRGIDIEQIKVKMLKEGLATSEEIKSMSDKNILNYIFEAGFSTAEKVSDISGRGVGLDVVKSNIAELNGIIDIETKMGKGTKFTIKLPLTLAIVQALLIKEEEYTFALPISSIIEIIRLKGEDIKECIHSVNGVEMFKWRENIIPLIRVGEYFSSSKERGENKLFIVVVGFSEKKAAFVFNKLLGEREIVIKSLGDFIGKDKLFGEIQGISGVSILGDGSFAYIIDLAAMIKHK
jgi:two-component system chemotaxis sensor kinase CheA